METEPTPWRKQLEEAAQHAIPGKAVHLWLLFGLLVLASILRLWNLPHIPFTHDEISALVRVRFNSFGELIAKGVAIDAHPSGVQVFEWIWTGLFGTGEAAVKLPFIVFSIAALFFLYRFAAAWTSPAAALLSIAFIGTIQYTVMYGQIARPYAVGFLTCALLMDQLTRALGGRRRAWAGAAIAAALCAYVHHFSLLFAALAWLSALFLAQRGQLKPLLVAGCIAVLLYLPELPITLRQYGYRGVGQWLLPPEPDWLPGYVAWVFEYSIPLAVVVLGSALAGWIRVYRAPRAAYSPFIPLCLVLGVLPLAIGYGYSLWRAPVLQYSVVLFSFPFLVFPLFAGWRSMRPSLLVPLTVLIAATAVFALVTVRKHYEVFYRSKYEAAIHGIIGASELPDRMALVDIPGEIPGFYFRQWGVDSTAAPYFNLRAQRPEYVDSLLRTASAGSVFYGSATGADPGNLPRIQQMFPFLAERHDMVEGQTFVFDGIPKANRLNDLGHRSAITPEAIKGEGWQVDAGVPTVRDTTAKYALSPKRWEMAGREFGIVYERSVYDISTGDNDILEAAMELAGAGPGSDLRLVMELKEGDRTIFYGGSTIQPGNGPTTLIAAIPLANLPQHGKGARLRTYVWNPGKKPAEITSFEVHVRAGNPWQYAFFAPLTEPLKFR